MGDIAEMILEGVLCQVCGELIDGEEPGYPRDCESCIPGGEIGHSTVEKCEHGHRARYTSKGERDPSTWLKTEQTLMDKNKQRHDKESDESV